MLLQTNSYIVPKEKRAEHGRLLRRFRHVLAKLGCDDFEAYEQVGSNWSSSEPTGRYVQIMRFRDRRHQLAVQAAERNDPGAQALIAEFCALINFPYQQQHGLFAVGFYSSMVASPVGRAAASELTADGPDLDAVVSPAPAAATAATQAAAAAPEAPLAPSPPADAGDAAGDYEEPADAQDLVPEEQAISLNDAMPETGAPSAGTDEDLISEAASSTASMPGFEGEAESEAAEGSSGGGETAVRALPAPGQDDRQPFPNDAVAADVGPLFADDAAAPASAADSVGGYVLPAPQDGPTAGSATATPGSAEASDNAYEDGLVDQGGQLVGEPPRLEAAGGGTEPRAGDGPADPFDELLDDLPEGDDDDNIDDLIDRLLPEGHGTASSPEGNENFEGRSPGDRDHASR